VPSDNLDGNLARSWVGAAALPMAIIALICIAVSTLFFRKQFHTLSAHSSVQLFRTTGNLLLFGTVIPIIYTSLVLALENIHARNHYASDKLQILMQSLGPLMALALIAGLILVYIAFILLAISFFSLKPAPSKCTNN
jgi:uncharacterized membrane protein